MTIGPNALSTQEKGVAEADEVWRELGRFIAARRRQLGMRTQQDLADTAGISLPTVTRLESGKRLIRRSRTWDLVEAALQLPIGYLDSYVSAASSGNPSGFLIQASQLSEIEPRARTAIKNAMMATLPGVTVSEILAAESAVIQALRDQGLLPPES